MNTRLFRKIKDYLESNIEDFDIRSEIAYRHMYSDGEPLCAVDVSLAQEIDEKVQEYCEEYDVAYNSVAMVADIFV